MVAIQSIQKNLQVQFNSLRERVTVCYFTYTLRPLGQQTVFFVVYENDGVIIMQFMILEIYFQNILKYINKNPNNCINKGGKEFKHTSYAYLATSP
jgi:hypothetical protein